ncbi:MULTISPECIES: calcium-binding protein [unclassified Pseudomonas]|uniref:calcium-binding protein n=1 Tax=unclassified Pseudomonas TaxID=196821 RepID=UPI0008E69FC9|nr:MULTISPECIES: calcium-binding protein [unclassified Pseudomonas]SFI15841.1 hypothetical protein SAMN03159342_02303 [Pseudomonas sp. NFPP04]SFI68907.1 hypothetical protein SAMN03159344_01604 [Pseudomonas sp. NFPP11]
MEVPRHESGVRQQALMALDEAHGPLRIGERVVHRHVLDEMGAQIGGVPLPAQRLNIMQADQGFIDQLTFSPHHLTRHLTAVDGEAAGVVTNVLFELASLRSEWAPPLLDRNDASDVTLNKLDRLLRSVQKVNLNDVSAVDSLPGWADKVRSGSYQSLGTGLQLYGFYSAIRGIGEAIRTGDTGDLLFEGGAFSAEVISLGLELALERAGTKMMSAAHLAYGGFRASNAGLRLQRGAGLIASILTLPFDIGQAVIAFKKALQTEGKVAQDHYVEAGFSLAGATLSIVLGVATLAGFSAAGPLGLVASALLIIGARVYAAARVVDDIDDYIELSTHERLRTGWFSFIGVELDESVLDRYKISRTHSTYAQSLRAQARSLLDGELKDSVQAVVNGRFEVHLQTTRHWKYQWDEAAGESAYKEAREPVIREVDDYFDARKQGALESLPEADWGVKGPEKGVLWLLGGGNDTVLGVPASPNHFRCSEGRKYLVGGSEDDEFIFDVSPHTFSVEGEQTGASTLIGAGGVNTLSFVGDLQGRAELGFNVNLGAGTVHLITDNSRNGINTMGLLGVENLSTLAGASSVATGSNDANRFVLSGYQDEVDAQAGDDQVLIQRGNANVKGGAGADYFEIAETANTVVIEEDGQQNSLILLKWAFSRIQRWWIAGNDLKMACVFGRDGELPGPSVTLKDVYALRENKRYVVNRLFSFLTVDGYRLMPLLADELDTQGDAQVSMEVIVPPAPFTAPTILGPGQSISVGAGNCDYFVSRGYGTTVIDASACKEGTRCCLYIDYDSSEIANVYTAYEVTTRRVSNFDYLDYSGAQIKFIMGNGRAVCLMKYAAQQVGVWTSLGGALQGSSLKVSAEYCVVMRDGVSYRLLAPLQSYVNDHARPGYKFMDGMPSRVLRRGHYPFFRPRQAKNIHLTAQSQRIELNEPPHQSACNLSGAGGIYDVHLTSWAIIALSTPGAADKVSDASTWNLMCAGLVEDIDLDNIIVSSGHISIGSALVRVPMNNNPDIPVENIRIYAKSGACFDVRLDINKVFLFSVAATPTHSVQGVLKMLRQCRQRSSVFTPTVLVKGISMADGAPGDIYYDVIADCWRVGADNTREVISDQLSI